MAESNEIETIINMLLEINVDGETMQHILKQVNMEEQMLKQLIMSSNLGDLKSALHDRVDLTKEYIVVM